MASKGFHAPEGAYELAYEVTPPPPSSATPMAPGISNVAVVAAAQQAQQEWPSCLATAVIRFPPSQSTGSGGILGLGGNQRSARSREPSAVESPQTSSAADESSSASSYDNANALPGASAASLQYANSTKRKPLISLPSSVGISSLSSGPSNAQQAPPASKPKSAFRGTSSTFVKAYEGLPFSGRADKLWAGQEYRDVSLAIFTAGKVIIIADISPRAKSRDPIARLAFGAIPVCLAVNQNSLSHDRLDLLVGFSTGDLMWIECFSGRYTRYNKDAALAANSTAPGKPTPFVSGAPVKKVQWLASDTIFAAAFLDGTMAFFDRDRDDPSNFTPSPGLAPQPGSVLAPVQPLQRIDSHLEGNEQGSEGHGSAHINGDKPSSRHKPYLAPLEEHTADIIVTIPQPGDRKNASKFNPIAHWKVSRKPITDFAFSPDNAHVAVVSEDGCLRILDAGSQRLLDTFSAYFGALTCVTWSPDGRFVLTGGQDDLACVWAPFEQRIVARCEGHASFLTGLAFDAWRCDGRTQRFASVSEDCRLILWELSSAALQRPKAHQHHTSHRHAVHSQQHNSVYNRRTSAMSSLSLSRRRTIESGANGQYAPAENEVAAPLWHRAPNRSEVPGLQPVSSKQISTELLSGIAFLPGLVVALTRNSTVKVFIRPDQRF